MNKLSPIKYFLYKLKKDLTSLIKYPDIALGGGQAVDYNRYWEKKRGNEKRSYLSSWQKQRADHILKIIEPGSSVMDLGCGDGAILKYLKDKVNIRGVGVDISYRELKKAEELGIETVKKDISNLSELDDLPEVDYILGLEIIEHLPNTEDFVNRIKIKAKKALIFSVPNTGYYIHRLRMLFGRFPLQWVHSPGEHLRFWTVKDTKWWVKFMGLELDKIILYKGLPFFNKFFPTIFSQGIIIKIKK